MFFTSRFSFYLVILTLSLVIGIRLKGDFITNTFTKDAFTLLSKLIELSPQGSTDDIPNRELSEP